MKVGADSIELKKGSTRDVLESGHFGTGNLEIRIGDAQDLERAKPLLQRSYEASQKRNGDYGGPTRPETRDARAAVFLAPTRRPSWIIGYKCLD